MMNSKLSIALLVLYLYSTIMNCLKSYLFSIYFRFETKMHQEKCVDISLAVEMLYMATVPNAYDIAVIVTGDMDFMPALEKTRLLGKRTAICSFRNSINQDMLAPEARIRDFDVIWLDEYLDQLIVPITAEREKRGEYRGMEWDFSKIGTILSVCSNDDNVVYYAACREGNCAGIAGDCCTGKYRSSGNISCLILRIFF